MENIKQQIIELFDQAFERKDENSWYLSPKDKRITIEKDKIRNVELTPDNFTFEEIYLEQWDSKSELTYSVMYWYTPTCDEKYEDNYFGLTGIDNEDAWIAVYIDWNPEINKIKPYILVATDKMDEIEIPWTITYKEYQMLRKMIEKEFKESSYKSMEHAKEYYTNYKQKHYNPAV